MCAAVRRSSLLKVGSTQYYASSSPGINLACRHRHWLTVGILPQPASFIFVYSFFDNFVIVACMMCYSFNAAILSSASPKRCIYYICVLSSGHLLFLKQTFEWQALTECISTHVPSTYTMDDWLLFFFFQIWEPPDLSIVGQERGRCIVHWPSILEKTLMNVTASNFPWLRGRQEEDKKKRIKRGGRPRVYLLYM